jgi:hypothetical protein
VSQSLENQNINSGTAVPELLLATVRGLSKVKANRELVKAH